MTQEQLDAENIALYTKSLCRENSKAEEMMQTVYNNAYEWDVGKSNRWIGYAQCLLVAEGATTIDELREAVRKIINKES